MNKINLKKNSNTAKEKAEENIEEYACKENIFNKLRHKIFGYREGEVEYLGNGVYRIYPTIVLSPEQKKEIQQEEIKTIFINIIIWLIANIIMVVITYGVIYLSMIM